ncbi:GntR family transcriptional regulator [Hansschlegelia zhihuaiae]|uniref:GntR family transcriptional regulator n=1 Tax=Hansschlegelia zhihuaiae TaxID=405005 RepID=A0A4Q0M340_9HYPH|nr:GntR family transcriptional regulator [Hansschlegelia zhihuaiae]RXF66976.1 GntR family transcriptional regulator [Hansschlegelia zhihuaiae]
MNTFEGSAEAAEASATGGADAPRPAQSLHGELLTALRDHIVEGNLADGARVPERELCVRFGVSRTPLREALKVLASEGLIDLLPNRGARIRPLRPQDVRELFDVMGGLEALAGRLACEKATDAEIAGVERLHYEMYGFYLKRDLHGYFRCNQEIHLAIVAAARNATLSETYAGLAARLRRQRYSANLGEHRDRWGEAMREHEEILDALQRRDGRALADILHGHLRNKLIATLEKAELASGEN